MRRSSDRGQFEPVVALVAVLAISAGLVTYADVLAGVLPGEADRETAETALDRVHDGLRVAGVSLPGRLNGTLDSAPDGWGINVTLRTRAGNWRAGPAPPEDGIRASRPVGVRVAPGRLRPGRLVVVVWP